MLQNSMFLLRNMAYKLWVIILIIIRFHMNASFINTQAFNYRKINYQIKIKTISKKRPYSLPINI